MNTSCDSHELSLHFISISLVYPHTTHLACLNTILRYFRQINKHTNRQNNQLEKRNQQFVATPGLNIYLSKYNFYVTNETSGINLKSLLQGEGTFLKRHFQKNGFYSLLADFNSQEKDFVFTVLGYQAVRFHLA